MIVRNAHTDDAAAMADILNRIIAIGGTTAHEKPTSDAEVREHYIEGPEVLSSVVAELDGQVIGWQSVGHFHGDPHIGSFVQPGIQAKGVGSGMFGLTCETLRAKGVGYILAWIRADNVPITRGSGFATSGRMRSSRCRMAARSGGSIAVWTFDRRRGPLAHAA
jgi:L-amino acid N-acyltransferase YncA